MSAALSGDEVLTTTNPLDGSPLATYPAMTPLEVDRALEATHRAARQWRDVSVASRAQLLRALADRLRADVEQLATRVTEEMGKPVAEARGEVEKSARAAEWYAAHAERLRALQND